MGLLSLRGDFVDANGFSDANCGAAYNAAVDDTVGGLVAGCSQSNPSNAASKPSGQPTCS